MHITQPTLVVDKQKAIANIKKMAAKAKASNCIFRPHLKTPQSILVANWYKQFGIKKATVSSVQMAQYFAKSGWDDITIAFPLNVLEIQQINELAAKIQLNILLESIDALPFLEKGLSQSVGVFIKIDTGYGRTGITWDNTSKIQNLLNGITQNRLLNFKGFLCHAGHTYNARGKDEILQIHEQTVMRMQSVKIAFQFQYPNAILSIGDTPSCSVAEHFNGINEIRPGNFIFYDLMQQQIGACNYNEIAVAMYCPIVAIHTQRNEIVIHGGGIHFSKDYIIEEDVGKIYGRVVSYNKSGKGWFKPIKDFYLSKLSQEHGIVKCPAQSINNYKLGDILAILPVHSCMAANLMKGFLSTDGEWLPIG